MSRTVKSRGLGCAVAAVLVATLAPADAQDLAWIRQFGTQAYDIAFAVAVDGTGRTFTAGATYGSLPGQTFNGYVDGFVRVHDATGAHVWTRQFGAPEGTFATSVAVDADGSVYVAGATYGAFGGQIFQGRYDGFLRRYDADGTHLWTRLIGTAGGDAVNGVALDYGSGNVYVSGFTDGSLSGSPSGSYDAFVRRYDATGAIVWTRQFGSAGHDEASAVAATSTGRVIVAGRTKGALPGQASMGDWDAFVRSLDASGAEEWTRQFGTAGLDLANGVGTDGFTAYIAGQTGGALPGQSLLGSYDAFVRRYDSAGSIVWTRQFGTAASDVAASISVAGTNAYLAGSTEGALGGASSAGGNDVFVRRLNFAGQDIWTTQFGSLGDDVALGVGTDGGRRVAVAGATDRSLPGNISAGANDAFTAGLLQRSCWDTQNPQGDETGTVSGPIHSVVEPPLDQHGVDLHRANCQVVVPAGL